MIVITAHWKAKEGREDQLKKHLETMVDQVREHETECLEYVLHQNAEDPTKFFFYEQYSNRNAIEFHKQTNHFKKLMNDTKGLVDDRVEVALYEVLI